MERWLSWSKAHDWKSCVPYKGTEGSNPSLSAKKESSLLWRLFFYMKWEGIRLVLSEKVPKQFRALVCGKFWFQHTAIARVNTLARQAKPVPCLLMVQRLQFKAGHCLCSGFSMWYSLVG